MHAYGAEPIISFSCKLAYGKTFLLDGGPRDGGTTVSWLIGGLYQENDGVVYKNELVFRRKQRQSEAWCVRQNQVNGCLGHFAPLTVQQQIRHGLKTTNMNYFEDEADYIRSFQLTPERYRRPLRQLSTEAWRASVAIGVANNRNIFCFPYMPPNLLNEYCGLWLKRLFDLLKDIGAVVIVPSTNTGIEKQNAILFDEVILLK